MELSEFQNEASWADLTMGPLRSSQRDLQRNPQRDPQRDTQRDIQRDIQRDRKKVRPRGYCYTCKPRGKVLKHIMRGCSTDNVIFHFDLHKRPIILATPRKHYGTLSDMPPEEQLELLGSVRVFCDFWGIRDYQVSYNCGEWQTQTHFHLKIKVCEKIVNRLRRDHFTMQGLTHNYVPTEPPKYS